jgi:ribosomal protein L19E
MAELTKRQLEALDSIIARMAADKVQTANMSADFTDVITDVVDAVTEAVEEVTEAIEEITGDIEDLIGNRVIISADRLQRSRERLRGRPTPSLEELVALRSLHTE